MNVRSTVTCRRTMACSLRRTWAALRAARRPAAEAPVFGGPRRRAVVLGGWPLTCGRPSPSTTALAGQPSMLRGDSNRRRDINGASSGVAMLPARAADRSAPPARIREQYADGARGVVGPQELGAKDDEPRRGPATRALRRRSTAVASRGGGRSRGLAALLRWICVSFPSWE